MRAFVAPAVPPRLLNHQVALREGSPYHSALGSRTTRSLAVMRPIVVVRPMLRLSECRSGQQRDDGKGGHKCLHDTSPSSATVVAALYTVQGIPACLTNLAALLAILRQVSSPARIRSRQPRAARRGTTNYPPVAISREYNASESSYAFARADAASAVIKIASATKVTSVNGLSLFISRLHLSGSSMLVVVDVLTR